MNWSAQRAEEETQTGRMNPPLEWLHTTRIPMMTTEPLPIQMPATPSEGIDIVWLKKDVRLHDHEPLSTIAASSPRQCIILYLYEPDQLSEKTVHGSHVCFVNEGLVDLDLRLSGQQRISTTATTRTEKDDIYQHEFKCITVVHAGAAFTLRTLHKQRPIHRILCHMESSHLKSFARDKAVRRWCRANKVPIIESNQTGVTRCIRSRDDFTTNFNQFLNKPMPATPTAIQLEDIRRRLVDVDAEGIKLHGKCKTPMNPDDMQEIPIEHRSDRNTRQQGGEMNALDMFDSFLQRRGANYSSGISSPNTSWTTGSRLSPYLTWGHISLRYVIVMTKQRQEELRNAKKNNAPSTPSPWLRSLASFQSRMHWRSHFMQKLETQSSLEVQDQCKAFSHLRRQTGDFRQEYYDAWCQGRTGFPFVDACMRCLIDCGWLNFRMRAMLVSFATYNLWLDWKQIAGHLARVFLDYEPGIHYPQLQMQAGTTGINAMRVYNVTKQGVDQDPDGVFIKKYVPELRNVPTEYIHEPSKMPLKTQHKCQVFIGSADSKGNPSASLSSMFQPIQQSSTTEGEYVPSDRIFYPSPIVNEKESAKAAKDKLSAVRKQESTKEEAERVYLKHGSRRTRSADRDGVKPKALNSTVKRVKVDKGQTLLSTWKTSSPEKAKSKLQDDEHHDERKQPPANSTRKEYDESSRAVETERASTRNEISNTDAKKTSEWSCIMCTFRNDKPLALMCSMCGSIRE